MAQPMNHSPNVIHMPATRVERDVVSTLRDQLMAEGSYADTPDIDAGNALFQDQLKRTAKYVAKSHKRDGDEAIDAYEAVSVLLDVGKPLINTVINEKLSDRLDSKGLTNPTQDEINETKQELSDLIRQGLINDVTPNDSHRVRDFLTDKVSSGAERFSITAKKTRAAYKHYASFDQEIESHPAGSKERQDAIEAKKTARNALVGRFAKTTGVVAVAAFAAESLRSKGFESPLSWIDDKGTMVKAAVTGVAMPGIAVGVEKLRNASLRGQINAMDKVGKAVRAASTGYRKTNFNWDMVKENDEAAYDNMAKLNELIIYGEGYFSTQQSMPGFDPSDPEYKANLEKQKMRIKERDDLEAQLIKEHGEKKLTLKGKVALGAVALVAAAGGAYLINKNGIRIPFTGNNSGNVDQATTHGGGSGTSTSTTTSTAAPTTTTGRSSTTLASTPTPTGSSSTSTTAAPTTTGSTSTTTTAAAPTTTAAPSTTLPTPGSGGGNTAGNMPPLPKGVNQSAYDQLTDADKLQFHANYDKLSGDEQKAFNHFVDGVQEFKQNNPTVPKEQRDEMLKTYFESAQNLRTGHPQATPDQINTLMDNTIQLAEQRAQAAGSGTVAQFDEQFRQYVEGAQQQTPEAKVIRLATQRAQYAGAGNDVTVFDEQFRQFDQAAQHQAQVNAINLAAERANYVGDALDPLKTLKETEFDEQFRKYIEALQNAS